MIHARCHKYDKVFTTHIFPQHMLLHSLHKPILMMYFVQLSFDQMQQTIYLYDLFTGEGPSPRL